jgi:hypothetical protein
LIVCATGLLYFDSRLRQENNEKYLTITPQD